MNGENSNGFCKITKEKLKVVDGGANVWIVMRVAAIACALVVGIGLVIVAAASTVENKVYNGDNWDASWFIMGCTWQYWFWELGIVSYFPLLLRRIEIKGADDVYG